MLSLLRIESSIFHWSKLWKLHFFVLSDQHIWFLSAPSFHFFLDQYCQPWRSGWRSGYMAMNYCTFWTGHEGVKHHHHKNLLFYGESSILLATPPSWPHRLYAFQRKLIDSITFHHQYLKIAQHKFKVNPIHSVRGVVKVQTLYKTEQWTAIAHSNLVLHMAP